MKDKTLVICLGVAFLLFLALPVWVEGFVGWFTGAATLLLTFLFRKKQVQEAYAIDNPSDLRDSSSEGLSRIHAILVAGAVLWCFAFGVGLINQWEHMRLMASATKQEVVLNWGQIGFEGGLLLVIVGYHYLARRFLSEGKHYRVIAIVSLIDAVGRLAFGIYAFIAKPKFGGLLEPFYHSAPGYAFVGGICLLFAVLAVQLLQAEVGMQKFPHEHGNRKTDEELRIHCPHCGQRIAVTRADSLLSVDCPTCGGAFQVPSLS